MVKRKHSGPHSGPHSGSWAPRGAPDAASGTPADRRPRGTYWLFGRHAVAAALANPRRGCLRLLVAEGTGAPSSPLPGRPVAEPVAKQALAQVLPPGAVHQGIALEVAPLPAAALDDAARPEPGAPNLVVVLDQVTDPRNVGAVLRSAAAFDARAVITTARHAPAESGVLAKAASGALERVPLVAVTNLTRALERLAALGYWRFGLDGAAPTAIDRADLSGSVALVLGAEGAGLRRLTAAHCDHLVRLPIGPAVESLNVSAAAAIALFVARRAAGSDGGRPRDLR